MKKLYLCRHGKTAWNLERRIQGLTDIELNHEGRTQANKLAKFLKKQINGPVKLLSSPLMRATQTASPIAEALDTTPEVDDRLIEINTGEFTGCRLDDLQNDQRWQLHLKDPWHEGYGIGGESSESVHNRMMALLNELMHKTMTGVAFLYPMPVPFAIPSWRFSIFRQPISIILSFTMPPLPSLKSAKASIKWSISTPMKRSGASLKIIAEQ
jgi:broad specificity phosphatase PhoE